jgi:large subunit ribosomal protein L9
MEVILRDHVDNLGRRGEIVKVAAGYARNYLLPRKLALPVTKGNLAHIERERGRFEALEAEERQAAQAVADRLVAVSVVIRRKVGETEALYGSVTSADIAANLAAQGFEFDKRKLQLQEPIKRLGEYSVPLKLHRDVIAPVAVRVLAEGAPERAPVAAAAEPTAAGTNDSEANAPGPAAPVVDAAQEPAGE